MHWQTLPHCRYRALSARRDIAIGLDRAKRSPIFGGLICCAKRMQFGRTELIPVKA